ncbi:L10-interacting MYB domain-containing protein [Nymphaea thermarum]|nr:L10-interacting MYB domain-containing protein [Nymphaea thermarum]
MAEYASSDHDGESYGYEYDEDRSYDESYYEDETYSYPEEDYPDEPSNVYVSTGKALYEDEYDTASETSEQGGESQIGEVDQSLTDEDYDQLEGEYHDDRGNSVRSWGCEIEEDSGNEQSHYRLPEEPHQWEYAATWVRPVKSYPSPNYHTSSYTTRKSKSDRQKGCYRHSAIDRYHGRIEKDHHNFSRQEPSYMVQNRYHSRKYLGVRKSVSCSQTCCVPGQIQQQNREQRGKNRQVQSIFPRCLPQGQPQSTESRVRPYTLSGTKNYKSVRQGETHKHPARGQVKKCPIRNVARMEPLKDPLQAAHKLREEIRKIQSCSKSDLQQQQEAASSHVHDRNKVAIPTRLEPVKNAKRLDTSPAMVHKEKWEHQGSQDLLLSTYENGNCIRRVRLIHGNTWNQGPRNNFFHGGSSPYNEVVIQHPNIMQWHFSIKVDKNTREMWITRIFPEGKLLVAGNEMEPYTKREISLGEHIQVGIPSSYMVLEATPLKKDIMPEENESEPSSENEDDTSTGSDKERNTDSSNGEEIKSSSEGRTSIDTLRPTTCANEVISENEILIKEDDGCLRMNALREAVPESPKPRLTRQERKQYIKNSQCFGCKKAWAHGHECAETSTKEKEIELDTNLKEADQTLEENDAMDTTLVRDLGKQKELARATKMRLTKHQKLSLAGLRKLQGRVKAEIQGEQLGETSNERPTPYTMPIGSTCNQISLLLPRDGVDSLAQAKSLNSYKQIFMGLEWQAMAEEEEDDENFEGSTQAKINMAPAETDEVGHALATHIEKSGQNELHKGWTIRVENLEHVRLLNWYNEETGILGAKLGPWRPSTIKLTPKEGGLNSPRISANEGSQREHETSNVWQPIDRLRKIVVPDLLFSDFWTPTEAKSKHSRVNRWQQNPAVTYPDDINRNSVQNAKSIAASTKGDVAATLSQCLSMGGRKHMAEVTSSIRLIFDRGKLNQGLVNHRTEGILMRHGNKAKRPKGQVYDRGKPFGETTRASYVRKEQDLRQESLLRSLPRDYGPHSKCDNNRSKMKQNKRGDGLKEVGWVALKDYQSRAWGQAHFKEGGIVTSLFWTRPGLAETAAESHRHTKAEYVESACASPLSPDGHERLGEGVTWPRHKTTTGHGQEQPRDVAGYQSHRRSLAAWEVLAPRWNSIRSAQKQLASDWYAWNRWAELEGQPGTGESKHGARSRRSKAGHHFRKLCTTNVSTAEAWFSSPEGSGRIEARISGDVVLHRQALASPIPYDTQAALGSPAGVVATVGSVMPHLCKKLAQIYGFDKSRFVQGSEGTESPVTNRDRKKLNWTPLMDRYFISLMVEEVHRGTRNDDSFSMHGWNRIEREFQKRFGIHFHRDSMRVRLEILRKQFNCMKTLSEERGFVWNHDMQMITASDESLWDDYTKVHPEAREYKGTKIPHYEDLCSIFSPLIVNGRYNTTGADLHRKEIVLAMEAVRAAGHPLSSLISSGRGHHANGVQDSSELAEDKGISNKRRKHLSVTPPSLDCSRKSYAVTCGVVKALHQMAAAVNGLASAFKEVKNCQLVEKYISALSEIPGMDPDLFLAACDLLEDERKARTFLALNMDLRKRWSHGETLGKGNHLRKKEFLVIDHMSNMICIMGGLADHCTNKTCLEFERFIYRLIALEEPLKRRPENHHFLLVLFPSSSSSVSASTSSCLWTHPRASSGEPVEKTETSFRCLHSNNYKDTNVGISPSG